MGLFLVPNASLLLGSYITTWEGQFSPHSYGKKWESLCRLLIKRFLVKISQNLPPPFWHGTQPGPHTSANALFGLGLRKYYVLAISVSNFITLSAFLLSIWIIFPVRLIMEGVLFMNFNRPTREWAKWVSEPINAASKRSERSEAERCGASEQSERCEQTNVASDRVTR